MRAASNAGRRELLTLGRCNQLSSIDKGLYNCVQIICAIAFAIGPCIEARRVIRRSEGVFGFEVYLSVFVVIGKLQSIFLRLRFFTLFSNLINLARCKFQSMCRCPKIAKSFIPGVFLTSVMLSFFVRLIIGLLFALNFSSR